MIIDDSGITPFDNSRQGAEKDFTETDEEVVPAGDGASPKTRKMEKAHMCGRWLMVGATRCCGSIVLLCRRHASCLSVAAQTRFTQITSDLQMILSNSNALDRG